MHRFELNVRLDAGEGEALDMGGRKEGGVGEGVGEKGRGLGEAGEYRWRLAGVGEGKGIKCQVAQ